MNKKVRVVNAGEYEAVADELFKNKHVTALFDGSLTKCIERALKNLGNSPVRVLRAMTHGTIAYTHSDAWARAHRAARDFFAHMVNTSEASYTHTHGKKAKAMALKKKGARNSATGR